MENMDFFARSWCGIAPFIGQGFVPPPPVTPHWATGVGFDISAVPGGLPLAGVMNGGWAGGVLGAAGAFGNGGGAFYSGQGSFGTYTPDGILGGGGIHGTLPWASGGAYYGGFAGDGLSFHGGSHGGVNSYPSLLVGELGSQGITNQFATSVEMSPLWTGSMANKGYAVPPAAVPNLHVGTAAVPIAHLPSTVTGVINASPPDRSGDAQDVDTRVQAIPQPPKAARTADTVGLPAVPNQVFDVRVPNKSVEVIGQPDESALIALKLRLPVGVVSKVVRFLNDENTVPFLARYRRDQVGHLSSDTLNEIRHTLMKVKSLQYRQVVAIRKLVSRNALTPALRDEIVKTKTFAELSAVLEPFKAQKKDAAGAARKLGLESHMLAILEGKSVVLDGLRIKGGPISRSRVETGVAALAAETFAKDPIVLNFIRLCVEAVLNVFGTEALGNASPKTKQLYSQFVGVCKKVEEVPAYQLLAIIRGEREKLLKVTWDVDDHLKGDFETFVRDRWSSCRWTEYEDIMRLALDLSYTRIIVPLMRKKSRAEAIERCEEVAVKYFMTNLKHSFLTPPLKGSVVIGIDPGFKHGCKVAVVSPTGSVRDAYVIHPAFDQPFRAKDPAADTLIDSVREYCCQIIAVGDGCASRNVHAWIQRLVAARRFGRAVRVLTISESGSSFYSCSEQAAKELRGMDCNLISAVSLARRVLDPLSELVKVDPKHLGVGMYQHEVSSDLLKDALHSVAVMCVSEVGADLNTASVAILQKIAGIGPLIAKAIVEFRDKHGPFTNRTQLLLVEGFSPGMFKQACGFLRILPMSAQRDSPMQMDEKTLLKAHFKARQCKDLGMDIELSMYFDLLDSTMVHPESYAKAHQLLRQAGVSLEEIRTRVGMYALQRYAASKTATELAREIGSTKEVYASLLEALLHPADHDCRAPRELPQGFGSVKSVEDIRKNMKIVGRVNNVVQFGAFVDLGVGHNGLLHRSRIDANVEGDLVLGSFAEFNVIAVQCVDDSYRIHLSFIRLV